MGARLARSGLIRSALVDAAAGKNMQLELGFGEPPPGDESDEALTALGYATVPLASVAEDVRPEVRDAIGRILCGSRSWDFAPIPPKTSRRAQRPNSS